VLTGDTGYIWRMGGVMLLIDAGADRPSHHRWPSTSARRPRHGLRARRPRSLFHQVDRLLGAGGGPLRRAVADHRITNDVQQVQMLVLMTCTMLIAAPIMMPSGASSWRSARTSGLSWLLAVASRCCWSPWVVIVSRMIPGVPAHAGAHRPVNQVLREQITGIRVVRAFVREPEETERFAEANDVLTATSLGVGG
jgi:ATP-binding cassette, subfamily B, multidrug efflux pump